jgi:hypothetical protein
MPAHDFTTWAIGTKLRKPAGSIVECPCCGQAGLFRVYSASPGRYQLSWWHLTDPTGMWARKSCRISVKHRSEVPSRFHAALDAFRKAGAKTEAGRLLDAHRRKQAKERKAKPKPERPRRRGKGHARDISGATRTLCGSPKGELVDDASVTCDRCKRKMKRDVFRMGKEAT